MTKINFGGWTFYLPLCCTGEPAKGFAGRPTPTGGQSTKWVRGSTKEEVLGKLMLQIVALP